MPIFGLANLSASLLNNIFGDDDEPFDFDDYVLKNLGNAMYRGPIGAIINADIGSRSGFSDLLWRPDPKRLSEVGLGTYILEQLGGPAFGIVKSFQSSWDHLDDGNVYRALESATPAAIRNFLKGARFATEGALNTKGYPIDDDVSAWSTFLQILGLTPNDLADKYARNNIMKKNERNARERKQSLLHAYNLARENGDQEEMRELRGEMQNFNRSTFGRLIPIVLYGKDSTLEKSWKTRQQHMRAALNGVVLDKKMRPALMESAGAEE